MLDNTFLWEGNISDLKISSGKHLWNKNMLKYILLALMLLIPVDVWVIKDAKQQVC